MASALAICKQKEHSVNDVLRLFFLTVTVLVRNFLWFCNKGFPPFSFHFQLSLRGGIDFVLVGGVYISSVYLFDYIFLW